MTTNEDEAKEMAEYKKNNSATTRDFQEKEITNDKAKSIETPSKTLLKKEDVKSTEGSNLKQHPSDKTAESEKDSEESSLKDPNKNGIGENKQAIISKPSKIQTEKAEETVVLFKSSHEPLKNLLYC